MMRCAAGRDSALARQNAYNRNSDDQDNAQKSSLLYERSKLTREKAIALSASMLILNAVCSWPARWRLSAFSDMNVFCSPCFRKFLSYVQSVFRRSAFLFSRAFVLIGTLI